MTAIKRTRSEHATTLALLAAGLSVAVIGLLALFGWVLDISVFTKWKASAYPMAPSTAVLSVLFGTALCLDARIPQSRVALLLTPLFGWVGVMITLLLFALRLLGVYGSEELLGLRITGMFGGMPIGYISPITAFCFLLAYGSLLTSLSYGVRSAWRGVFLFGFGGLVTLMSFTLLLVFVFDGGGEPFGKALIPPALNTSLSLLIIGLAQLVLAGRYTGWLTTASDRDTIRPYLYVLVFLAFAVVTLVVAHYYYRSMELRFRQDLESQLLTVSELKTDELVRWRRERFWDATFYQNIVFTAAVRRFLETPRSVSAQREMQDLLNKYRHHMGYDRAFLLDAKGIIRMSVPSTAEPTAAILVEGAAAALKRGQVMLQDFYRDEHDQRVYLALMVPILDQQNDNRPLGVVVLRIDPSIYLYPLIKFWPAPSATAETLLVRRDGNDVLFLSDLRFHENAALSLRFPLTRNTDLPAVKAVLGQRGIVDGVDYRGEQVIAAVRAIPDSPWHIVTRMDISEVYASLRERMWLTVLLVSVLVCGAGMVVIFLWRLQRLVYYQRQNELTSALQESEKRCQSILHTAMDGFWLTDTQGRLLDANETYCRLSGYSEQELLTMRITDLDAFETDEDITAHLRSIMAQGEDRFESRHRRKDGSTFEVEVSIQYQPVEGGRCIVFVHDITDRKMTEKALKASKAQLDFALQKIMTGAWELNLWDNTAQRTLLHDRIFGYETLLPSWTYEMFLDHVLPEDRLEVDRSFREALAAKGEWSFECRIRRTDGEVRWIYAAGCHVQNSKDEPELLSGIVQDITERKLAEEALRLSELQFRTLAEAMPQIVWIARPDGSNIYINQQWVDYSGLTLEESYGHGWTISIHPDDQQRVWDAWQHALKTDGTYSLEFRLRRADGIYRWWLIRAVSLHNAKGKVVNWFGTCTDIQYIKEAEEKLLLAASVFTHAREGIMITDADGTIIDVNDTFCDITGYSRDEVLGQNPRILSSGLQEKEFYDAMWRDLVELGYWNGEVWNRRKNGEVYAVMQTISAVRGEQGNTRHYVALYSDITLLKENEQKLERSAHFDALTSLPNRVLLADRLQQGMAQTRRRGQRLAVAFLDLDGFKAINDNYGHEAGDQLLITVSERMKQALREGDTLGRLGGDEFVAVLTDIGDIEASLPMLSRLLATAAEPVQYGDITLQVSASLGVTFYPQAEDIDADQLLRQADQSMYQAKQAGKNRYHLFDADQDSHVRGRYEGLEHIRQALAAGEFVLYYQPKVNMRTGTVTGAEALIRWQHPEKGLLLPDLFLPEIEDHALATDFGEWVIDTALAQMESWQAAGLNIPVSVNIGARQLQQKDFVDRLRALLTAHPTISPGDLELEVLETSAMEDLAKASGVIDACRKLGVSFALDDFGTGYSSLTYLKHLPVAQLKIDRSFVRDMIDNPADLSIVEGVIGLATAFRLLVIAEGTETAEHSTILLQLGCDLAQGFGIAHPMPASQLPGWEATWQPNPAWINLASVSRVDLPLLFASVEHRAWIIAMEKYLKGGREVPPSLDIHQCRFGQWLNTEGLARLGGQPNFQAIELLHRQVHALAAELYTLQAQGRKQEALARLGELHDLRDALLDQLTLAKQSQ